MTNIFRVGQLVYAATGLFLTFMPWATQPLVGSVIGISTIPGLAIAVLFIAIILMCFIDMSKPTKHSISTAITLCSGLIMLIGGYFYQRFESLANAASSINVFGFRIDSRELEEMFTLQPYFYYTIIGSVILLILCAFSFRNTSQTVAEKQSAVHIFSK